MRFVLVCALWLFATAALAKTVVQTSFFVQPLLYMKEAT